MSEYLLSKRAGLRLITSWKTGQACFRAEDVDFVLAKKQAELLAVQDALSKVSALVKRLVSELEGVAK